MQRKKAEKLNGIERSYGHANIVTKGVHTTAWPNAGASKIRHSVGDAHCATLNDTGEDEIKRTEEAVAS